MEIYKIKAFRILVLTALGLVFSCGAEANNNQEEKQITAVTTNTILADMVKNVGGSKVKVTSIVGLDQEMHNYVPKPKDITKINEADVVIANGLNIDNWVERGKDNIKIIYLSDGLNLLTHYGETDPHCWNSPVNGQKYVSRIARELCNLSSKDCTFFTSNSEQYQTRIKEIYSHYLNNFNKLSEDQRILITSHEAFNYLAEDFNLRIIAINSINEHNEISAGQLANIIKSIKDNHIKTIFLENASNSKFTNQIVNETGITIGGILYSDSLSKDEEGSTYLKLLEHNLSTIYKGISE